MIYYVYIVTNADDHVLYTGVTNNLERRIFEHREGLIDGFSKRYGTHKLVYHEHTNDIRDALAREKQIKGWTRKKKIALVESSNPQWLDLK